MKCGGGFTSPCSDGLNIGHHHDLLLCILSGPVPAPHSSCEEVLLSSSRRISGKDRSFFCRGEAAGQEVPTWNQIASSSMYSLRTASLESISVCIQISGHRYMLLKHRVLHSEGPVQQNLLLVPQASLAIHNESSVH